MDEDDPEPEEIVAKHCDVQQSKKPSNVQQSDNKAPKDSGDLRSAVSFKNW